MAVWVSCTKVPPPETVQEPPPTVAPAPTVKVHPAPGAKEAAMKMYPELAVKDSIFNKTFVDLYAETKQKNPDMLTRADWPLLLARHTANLLSVNAATPEPQAIPSAPPTPTPNALERGAYNQKRISSPYATPWIRY